MIPLRKSHPGPPSPGLIEARFGSSSPDERRSPIRGLLAPASLKRLFLLGGWRLMDPIRGLLAPASLKR